MNEEVRACRCHTRKQTTRDTKNPLQTDLVNHFRVSNARWFIASIFKTQYNSGNGFQATISPICFFPGSQQSLRCEYIETSLQSACDHATGFYN